MAILAPEAEVGDAATRAFEVFFLRGDDCRRSALEFEPSEIAGPSTNERLSQCEECDQQSCRNRVVLGLQSRMDHVGERNEQCSSEHEIRHNAQERDWYGCRKDQRRQSDPLDAAQVGGDIRLRGGVDGLEKPLAKDAVINNRLVDEPGEAWRAVDLAFPLGCAGRAEEHKVLEAQHGLRLAVAFLLFAEGL